MATRKQIVGYTTVRRGEDRWSKFAAGGCFGIDGAINYSGETWRDNHFSCPGKINGQQRTEPQFFADTRSLIDWQRKDRSGHEREIEQTEKKSLKE